MRSPHSSTSPSSSGSSDVLPSPSPALPRRPRFSSCRPSSRCTYPCSVSRSISPARRARSRRCCAWLKAKGSATACCGAAPEGLPRPRRYSFAAMVWIVRRGARSAAALARLPATSTSEQLALIVAASMLAVSYVLVLVAARLLADPGIPFDERLLSPLFLLVTIIIAVAASAAWRDSRRTLRVLGAVVFLSWWLASYRASSDEVSYTLENGHDLTEIQWRTSPLLAWARANAPRRPLYSNWPSADY